jgi:hypothetical protein
VDSGEVIVPVDGLGIEIEHVVFGGLHHHHHHERQPLHVGVIKASSPANKIYASVVK